MTSPLLKTLVVPAASGTATASVIFAHGLGDSGLGWLDVAKMLSRRPSLNHVRFILPNAPVQPVSLNMGMPMPSWFDITTLEDISEAEDERGLLKSSGEINRLIQAEIDGSAEGLGGKGIEAGRVVVGGFSQVSGGAGRSEPASKAEASTSRAGNSIVKVTSSSSAIADAAKALLQSFSGSAGSDGSRGIRKGSILGVGVDIMHRPRLASLLRRQERRLRSPVDSAVSMRHFARRILCQVEADELSALSKATTIPLGSLEQWLAVRWTAKEAAYKALYPHLPVRWSDLRVSKGEAGEKGDRKPRIAFSEESRSRLGSASDGVRLHLSGGAIAYLTGLTHPSPLAGIIALSSWLPLKSKIVSLLSPHAKDTPVFHGHGSSDQIVQFAFGKRTVEFLKGEAEGGLGMGELKTASGAGGKAKGVKFEIYKGMAHSACPEEIEHVGQFLETIVPKQ